MKTREKGKRRKGKVKGKGKVKRGNILLGKQGRF